MWARIENGIVNEITNIDPAGRFHASLHWKVCPDGVAVGWRCEGEAYFAPEAAPPFASTRDQVMSSRLRAYADPITGSDRYFAEAQRENLMGNTEAARIATEFGFARFASIQAEHPWPSS